MLDGPARILYSAAAYRIPQKAWKLHVGRSGAHSVFCRSIQNPPKGVETACWTVRRAFCILPQHTESPKRRGNCMLDGPARILYSAFCILPATCACDAYAWEQRWHMSGCWILDSGNWAVGGVWAARILYSVFCILYSAGRSDLEVCVAAGIKPNFRLTFGPGGLRSCWPTT